MNTARRIVFGIVFVVALLLAIVVMHLVRINGASYLARGLMETFHTPGFAVIAFGLAWGISRRFSIGVASAAAFVIALGLGVFGEFIQIFVQRDASIGDIVRDLVGILAGLAVFAAVTRNDARRGETRLGRATPIIASIVVVVSLLPTLWFGTMIVMRWHSLPELLTFEKRWESSIHLTWPDIALQVVDAPDGWPLEGRVGLLRFDDTRMPALIFDPYPDWREFDAISFLAASATGETETVQLRIHGSKYTLENGDRFDMPIDIEPMPHRVRIPMEDIRSVLDDEPIDLSAIIAVRIRALAVRDGFRIYVDDFRLERD